MERKTKGKVLCEQHLSLVLKLAHKWKRFLPRIEFDDLVAEGNLIMVIAVKTFDETKGQFSTYLWNSINRHFCLLFKKEMKKANHFSSVNDFDVFESKSIGVLDEILTKEKILKIASKCPSFAKFLVEGDDDFFKFLKRKRRLKYKTDLASREFKINISDCENFFGFDRKGIKEAIYNHG